MTLKLGPVKSFVADAVTVTPQGIVRAGLHPDFLEVIARLRESAQVIAKSYRMRTIEPSNPFDGKDWQDFFHGRGWWAHGGQDGGGGPYGGSDGGTSTGGCRVQTVIPPGTISCYSTDGHTKCHLKSRKTPDGTEYWCEAE